MDEIYNLACPASPIHYQFDPVQTTKTSVHGAINMLGLAKRVKAQDSAGLDQRGLRRPDGAPAAEAYWGNVNPIGPRSCYDEGKRCAETLFFDYHRQHGVRIKVARIFNTYGPRMHPDDGRVVSNFIVQALRGEPITVFGDGQQTRSFCYVDDLDRSADPADGIAGRLHGPVNLGNPAEFTILELAQTSHRPDRVPVNGDFQPVARRRSAAAPSRYHAGPATSRLAAQRRTGAGAAFDDRLLRAGDRARRATGVTVRGRERATWLNLAAKLAGAGLSVLQYVVLARVMTPEAFADVAVVLVWLTLATILASLSMPLVVVRFVAGNLADGRADLAQGVVRFALTATLGAGAVVGGLAAIAVLAGWVAPPHDLGTCILIASVLVPPSVVVVVLAGVLQSFQRVAAGELLVNVVRPTLMLVALLGLWWWHREPLSAPTVFVLYLIATAVILPTCLAYAYAVRPTAMMHVKPAYDRSKWLRSALAFAGVALAAALNERVDMILLGVTAPAREIAVYAVAVRFAQIFAVATSAVTAVLAPQLFDHVGELRSGRSAPMEALVRRNARTVLRICVLAAAAFVIIGPLLLKLFGPTYASAYAPLVILAAGQLLAALFGPAAMVATFIGAPRIAVGSLAAGIVVNAALNLVLVPTLGSVGAAAATAAGTVAIAVGAWAWTRLRFDLDTAVVAVFRGPRA